jgi:hypothetical protein
MEDLSNSVARELLRNTECSLSLILEQFVYSFPNIPKRFSRATVFDACIERGFGYRTESFAFVVLNMLILNV